MSMLDKLYYVFIQCLCIARQLLDLLECVFAKLTGRLDQLKPNSDWNTSTVDLSVSKFDQHTHVLSRCASESRWVSNCCIMPSICFAF